MDKILFVLPYQGIMPILKSALTCFPEFDVEFWPGYVEPIDGQNFLSKSMEEYRLIIAQGEDCIRLRKRYELPVVEIQFSDYDILTAAKLADGYQGKSVMLLSPDLAKKARSILDLVTLPMAIYTLKRGDNALVVTEKLCSDGYSLILTTPEISRVCQAHGIANIMLAASYQTLIQCLRDAQSLAHSLGKIERKLKLIQHYLKITETTYVIFDKKGHLVESLHCPKNDNLISAAQSLIPALLRQNEVCRLKMVNKTPYLFRALVSKIDGQIFLFFEVKPSLENTKTRIPGIIIKNSSNLSKDFFNVFYDDLSNLTFKQKVLSYSHSNDPIVIIGESGTGKSRLADFIYDNCTYRENLLYEIDCKQLDKYGINYMFRNITSPLYSTNLTLYFKELNLTNKKYIDELIEFLQQSACLRNNKVIFSITCKISESFDNKLCKMLMSRLSSFPLYLLPLRERLNDIPNLATLYLNEMNQELGKSIVGFEPEAMSYLQGFEWYDNVKQFKRVLKQLFILTPGLYVNKKDTISVLHDEIVGNRKTRIKVGANKLPTLQKLTFDAVQKAMLSNNMNKTRAAKQLGISRTTLWRILK